MFLFTEIRNVWAKIALNDNVVGILSFSGSSEENPDKV